MHGVWEVCTIGIESTCGERGWMLWEITVINCKVSRVGFVG